VVKPWWTRSGGSTKTWPASETGGLSDGELLAAIRGSFAPEALIGFNVIGELLGAVGFFFFYNLLLFSLCEKWFRARGAQHGEPAAGGRGWPG